MTPETFCMSLEQYFSKKYNPTQATEIKRVAKRLNDRSRDLVYRSILSEERFLPLIVTIKAHAERVYEGYPELDKARGQEISDRQITDDAGITDEEIERNLAELRKVVGGIAMAKKFTDLEA